MLIQYFVLLALSLFAYTTASEPDMILNVSYDPTREFYDDYNQYFENYWLQKTGHQINVAHSHGGSAKQARSVINGLQADVVSLALAYDINVIAKQTGLIASDWQTRLPFDSTPYTSTIVFLVRKGNPKNIRDWEDLIKPGISVIAPNPKTSGAARWTYLAAWGYATKKWNDNPLKTMTFLRKLYANVPVLATGAREATTTFVQRQMGDVLLSWENEALLVLQDICKDECEIVMPSLSILAEPSVALVDKIVDRHHTRPIAEAYLQQLYSKEGQELIAKNFFRPRDTEIAKKHAQLFPDLPMITIKEFGGWDKAQKVHFNDGGTFDKVIMFKYDGQE